MKNACFVTLESSFFYNANNLKKIFPILLKKMLYSVHHMDSILLISNDKSSLFFMKNALQEYYKLYNAVDKEYAVNVLRTCFVRLIIINISNIQEVSTYIEYFQNNYPHVAIMLFDHHMRLSGEKNLMYVDKTNIQNLWQLVRTCIDLNDAKLIMNHDNKYPAHIVAHSNLMKMTMSKLERAYMDNQTVMLCGERGSGLSTLAHYIHLKTNRKQNRFYEIDCRTIKNKDDLVRALMGQIDKNNGPFFLALGGTVVLDHLDSVDSNIQNVLLQLLSRITSNIDLKIISIVSSNIRHSTDNGTFKYQLYEKLANIFISIPALRDRVDDIVPLLRSFALPHQPEITIEQKEMLDAYTWSGNLTELKHLTYKMLLNDPQKLNLQYLSNNCGAIETSWDKEDFNTVKHKVMRAYCRYLTHKYHGNQTKASQHAGIDRSTFYRCMHYKKK